MKNLSVSMTPKEFKAARRALGLSAQGMANLLGVKSGRTVRRWEAGDRKMSPTVVFLLKKILEENLLA